jgi:iron complex outermembrane receptor protein
VKRWLPILCLVVERAALADQPAAPQATTVTAHAQPPTAPAEDRAAAASVVRPEDSPHAHDDLASLLAEVPGVAPIRTGSIGAFTTITVRGSNPDEVRIYVDGVPLNIAAGGAVDISTLPLGDVERVEVYRGTSPLVFGQSALGGIIAITTRTPGTTSAAAKAGVGSFGTSFADLTAGGRVGRLRLYLGLHGLTSLGDFPYRNDNGTALNPNDDTFAPRQNNDVTEGNGVARAALTLTGRRSIELGLIGFAREQGLPGRGGVPTTETRFSTDRALATLRYQSRDDLGPGGRLSARLYAAQERNRFRDPLGDANNNVAASTHDVNRSAGTDVYAARPFTDWLRGEAILEGRVETHAPEDDLAPTPIGLPARRLTAVAGGELGFLVRRLDLEIITSARAEAMSDLVSKRDLAGTPIATSPIDRVMPVLRAGLVRPLGEHVTLKANAGAYVRAPSFLELYGTANTRFVGNPDLVPEHGRNADVAVWVERSGDRLSLASRTGVFGALVDDLIEWQVTSWGQARPVNTGAAHIYGAEQELRLGVGRHARLTGQLTYLAALDASNNTAAKGRQIPFHPRYTAYARPEVVRLPLPGGTELGLFADVDFRAQSYGDPANANALGTRVLVGAGVSVAWPRARVRVIGSAANLTNTQIQDVVDWPLPGRSFFVALAYAPIGGDDTAIN